MRRQQKAEVSMRRRNSLSKVRLQKNITGKVDTVGGSSMMGGDDPIDPDLFSVLTAEMIKDPLLQRLIEFRQLTIEYLETMEEKEPMVEDKDSEAGADVEKMDSIHAHKEFPNLESYKQKSFQVLQKVVVEEQYCPAGRQLVIEKFEELWKMMGERFGKVYGELPESEKLDSSTQDGLKISDTNKKSHLTDTLYELFILKNRSLGKSMGKSTSRSVHTNSNKNNYHSLESLLRLLKLLEKEGVSRAGNAISWENFLKVWSLLLSVQVTSGSTQESGVGSSSTDVQEACPDVGAIVQRNIVSRSTHELRKNVQGNGSSNTNAHGSSNTNAATKGSNADDSSPTVLSLPNPFTIPDSTSVVDPLTIDTSRRHSKDSVISEGSKYSVKVDPNSNGAENHTDANCKSCTVAIEINQSSPNLRQSVGQSSLKGSNRVSSAFSRLSLTRRESNASSIGSVEGKNVGERKPSKDSAVSKDSTGLIKDSTSTTSRPREDKSPTTSNPSPVVIKTLALDGKTVVKNAHNIDSLRRNSAKETLLMLDRNLGRHFEKQREYLKREGITDQEINVYIQSVMDSMKIKNGTKRPSLPDSLVDLLRLDNMNPMHMTLDDIGITQNDYDDIVKTLQKAEKDFADCVVDPYRSPIGRSDSMSIIKGATSAPTSLKSDTNINTNIDTTENKESPNSPKIKAFRLEILIQSVEDILIHVNLFPFLGQCISPKEWETFKTLKGGIGETIVRIATITEGKSAKLAFPKNGSCSHCDLEKNSLKTIEVSTAAEDQRPPIGLPQVGAEQGQSIPTTSATSEESEAPASNGNPSNNPSSSTPVAPNPFLSSKGSRLNFRPESNLTDLLFGNPEDIPRINLEEESIRDWYRKSAGMHTVQKWCENYQKHPYSWGALIMIHGVDEICFRLRTKVENYAVYSAIFLSASVVLLMCPAEKIFDLCTWYKQELIANVAMDSQLEFLYNKNGGWVGWQQKNQKNSSTWDDTGPASTNSIMNYTFASSSPSTSSFSLGAPLMVSDPDSLWICHIQIRLYFYSIVCAIVCHVTAILLAMSFVNAFNEAGRDADIIRLFAEGKGYVATVKCENAFRYGLCLLTIAGITSIWIYLSVIDALLMIVGLYGFKRYGMFQRTSKLLFEASSLVHYWRWGRGHASGKDPFKLDIPIERLQRKCEISRLIHTGFSIDDPEEGKSKDSLASNDSLTTSEEDTQEERIARRRRKILKDLWS